MKGEKLKTGCVTMLRLARRNRAYSGCNSKEANSALSQPGHQAQPSPRGPSLGGFSPDQTPLSCGFSPGFSDVNSPVALGSYLAG